MEQLQNATILDAMSNSAVNCAVIAIKFLVHIGCVALVDHQMAIARFCPNPSRNSSSTTHSFQVEFAF